MKRATITIAVILLSLGHPAGAFDFVTADGNGMGQTVILSNSSASTLLLAPSGGLIDRQWKVDLGAIRTFDLKELDRAFMSAAYRRGSVTCAGGFISFGDDDLYAERTGRLSVAYQYDSVSVGVNCSYMQVGFGGHYPDLNAFSVGLGASYRTKKVFAAFVAEDINSPGLYDHSESILPRYTLYTELIGPGSYSITGRISAQKREKPQLGAGQKIDISSIAAVFWGLSTEPFIYGAGLELIYKRSFITYATSYHPTLGFSHTLSLSFAFGREDSEQP
ncbi:MAG: hypothetical protein AB1483_04750 [Candidatus Zixiibacteriota bacterium]